MKCLTICQPYPELILQWIKRTENRTWPTAHRGKLLIHAGKSTKWLKLSHDGKSDRRYDLPIDQLQFGMIVGICDLVGCVELLDAGKPHIHKQWPWLLQHKHASGPVLWIVENALRFVEPIPWRGEQGLFDVPDNVVRDAISTARGPNFQGGAKHDRHSAV